MSNLNSKFVKPVRKSKKYNSYILHVKGDWNDFDLYHRRNRVGFRWIKL